MGIRQYKDWASWWDGLRTSMIKAGATSLVTNLTVFTTTNTVNSIGIPGLSGSGENWKTAIATCLIQFSLRVIFAAAQYVANKPDPDVITEILDTTHISRNPDTGSVEVGMSTTVKTTPLSPVATDAANPPKP